MFDNCLNKIRQIVGTQNKQVHFYNLYFFFSTFLQMNRELKQPKRKNYDLMMDGEKIFKTARHASKYYATKRIENTIKTEARSRA